MKRITIPFITLILLFLAASCEDELPTPSDGMQETVLVLNSWLSSADTLHSVTVVASSISGGLIEAKHIEVSIYVNGTLADRSGAGLGDSENPTKEYTLKARFFPGDTVELVAEGPLGRASARSVIPPAPVISDVSFDGQVAMYYYEYANREEGTFDVLRFNILDPPGRGNVYKISLFRECDYVLISDEPDDDYPFSSTRPVGWTSHFPSEQFDVYNMLEPAMQVDWGRANYANSRFNLFTDRSFDGSPYRVTILSKPDVYYSYSWGGRETWAMRRKATIRAEAISEEAYRYYTDVEYASGGYSVIPMFYEPPALPSNVVGGIGFVCFASAAECGDYVSEELYGWRGKR